MTTPPVEPEPQLSFPAPAHVPALLKAALDERAEQGMTLAFGEVLALHEGLVRQAVADEISAYITAGGAAVELTWRGGMVTAHQIALNGDLAALHRASIVQVAAGTSLADLLAPEWHAGIMRITLRQQDPAVRYAPGYVPDNLGRQILMTVYGQQVEATLVDAKVTDGGAGLEVVFDVPDGDVPGQVEQLLPGLPKFAVHKATES